MHTPKYNFYLQKMRARGTPMSYRGQLGSMMAMRPRPPVSMLSHFCRFCGKGYGNLYSCRRHERDAHGPRMKCSHCFRFSCPESRVSEMRNHLRDVHGVESGPPPAKRARREWDVLPGPTIRIPQSPMPTMEMGQRTPCDLNDDLGADPDVSVEPAEFLQSLGPGGDFHSHPLSIPSYSLSSSSTTLTLGAETPTTTIPNASVLHNPFLGVSEDSVLDDFFLDGDCVLSLEEALPAELAQTASTVDACEPCPISTTGGAPPRLSR